jgi:transposase
MVASADSRVEHKAIAIAMECSVWTVRRWIQRSKTTGDLQDRPRSGRPALYSEETKLCMVAFYCQTQPLPGCGRWTMRWAARHLKADPTKGDVTPSKSTLHRILQNNRLKPHQSRYFLHITDPDFFPKMEHLLALYKNPPGNLFFFDECPGIQILKRLTPDLQTDAMRQRLEELEYIRHGTLDVLAFFHHEAGKVVLECRADHTTETFLGVFRRHVERFASTESLHYVMDNLSSHRGYPFCRMVAELSGVVCPKEHLLKTKIERMQWLSREDKRIVIHFTPYHGSRLNWVEIWFGIMGQKVLGESFGAPDELKAALEAFAENWNLLWAHPFQWSYDGKGLHQKAVKRFTTMLCGGAEKMELRTLTKLLTLTTNLLNAYLSHIPEETWHQFAIAVSAQYENINALIQREQRPLPKKNAQRALAVLSDTLQRRSLPAGQHAA